MNRGFSSALFDDQRFRAGNTTHKFGSSDHRWGIMMIKFVQKYHGIGGNEPLHQSEHAAYPIAILVPKGTEHGLRFAGT